MIIPIPEEDRKEMDEIDKWLIFNDSSGKFVFREDTPPEIITEQERIKKIYLPFD